jgi:hypothetical protein
MTSPRAENGAASAPDPADRDRADAADPADPAGPAGPAGPADTDVYLHIGLPKSGTSYLQDALWASRQQLSDHGVLVPGHQRVAHNRAAWDLLGRRSRGADQPHVVGAWPALVDEVRAWRGSAAVISEEFLAFARPGQVRQAVRAFAPARVHVVVTVRDLARVLVGSWQQQLAQGKAWTWDEYAAAVRDPERGPASAGVAFWLRQDVVRVLDVWHSEVPHERVHVVTVPPAGSPPELLAERFAAATGLDPAWLVSGDHQSHQGHQSNVSVGVAEAEVLRQLNASLGERLNERQYTRVVARGVRQALQDRPQPLRMALPDEHLDWVSERSTAMVDELRRREYHMAGRPDDLLPQPGDGTAPGAVQPAELADAAMAALGTVVEQYATFWWKVRARDQSDGPGHGDPASSARAAAGRVRLGALRLMDRNRLVRRVAIRYLNRSPR